MFIIWLAFLVQLIVQQQMAVAEIAKKHPNKLLSLQHFKVGWVNCRLKWKWLFCGVSNASVKANLSGISKNLTRKKVEISKVRTDCDVIWKTIDKQIDPAVIKSAVESHLSTEMY